MALKRLWRRTRPGDRLVVAVLLLLSLGLLVVLRPGPPGRRVVVEQAGRVIFTAPLDEPRAVALEGPLGTTRLAIRDGTVCVEAAPCPHRVCIGMGAIGRAGELVACVPNDLLVRIEGGPPSAPKPATDYDLLSR